MKHTYLTAFALLCVSFNASKTQAQFAFTPVIDEYYEDFDGFLGNASTLPSHWTLNSPLNFNNNGCGTNNAGGVYSFSTTVNSEKALGYLPSTSATSFSAQLDLVNLTGQTITELSIEYNFETWRRVAIGANPASTGRVNGFEVQTDIPGADMAQLSALAYFQEPVGSSNTLGCHSDMQVSRSTLLTGLIIAPGTTFYIRWYGDRGTGSGSSSGIAIDDVRVRVPCRTYGTFDTTICQGQSLLFNGNTYSASTGAGLGINDTFPSTTPGCDSVVTLNLTVVPALSGMETVTICQGQSYTFNGINYTNSNNTATDTLQNLEGCDSVVTLDLMVMPVTTTALNATICQGQVYFFAGNGYTTSQNVADTFVSSTGCDSIVTLDLTVIPVVTSTLDDTICQGQGYVFNGNTYTTGQAGLTATFQSAGGCDSIVTLNLTVIPIEPTTNIVELKGCDVVYYAGQAYYRDSILSDTIFATSGCDSIYSYVNIELTGQEPLRTYHDTFACEAILFNGQLFNDDALVIDTIRSVHGCDSVIRQTGIAIGKLDLQLSIDPEDPYEMERFEVMSTESSDLPYTVLRWSPEEHFPGNDLSRRQVISLKEATMITMIGRSESGCPDTAGIFIEPRGYKKDIAVPNAFTPNGDGLNDVFMPKLLLDRAYSAVQFVVYNRFGQVVHSTANRNSGWDGTSNGRPAEQGVYFYSIKIIFADGTSTDLKGEVSLLR